ncbi:MAG: arylsulfatase [Caulobacterales bacterium]|nr:arylsulfatase [Caulobacterales bacterium]
MIARPRRLAALAGALLRASCAAAPAPRADPRPNILVIIADDMGYSDIAPFGGEIATPNLSRLAERGVRFSDFNVHTMCTPTRAMLLSGANNHVAGVGTMAGEWRGEQRGAPGYETYLTDRVVTVPQLLADAGYATFISGKWDMGGRNDPALLPGRRGFTQSFVLVEGSADHFREFPALLELDRVHYTRDDAASSFPDGGYSSDLFTDELIAFLGRAGDAPFFAMLSFTAPHWPLQAQDDVLARHDGAYDAGYEAIRAARVERQRVLGLIGPDAAPAPPEPLWPAWEDLPAELRALEAVRMQIYAAMVESMDANIGRVLDALSADGRLEDTVIVFLSDNGATGGNPLDWGPAYPAWAEETFDNSLQNLGRPGSYVWYGPQWAHVSNTPFRLAKGFPTRGGLASPLIVAGPGVSGAGDISHAFAAVTDLAATFLDWAEVEHPGDTYQGRAVAPLEGRSMAPHLAGAADRVRDEDMAMVWEIMGRRAVRRGEWKALAMNAPWGAGADVWTLHNLADDPTELTDVADQHPDILAELVAAWDAYAAANGVIFDPYDDLAWSNAATHFDWRPEEAER